MLVGLCAHELYRVGAGFLDNSIPVAPPVKALTVAGMEITNNFIVPTATFELAEPAHLAGVDVAFVTDTASMLRVFAELADAQFIAADTETVARNEDGSLRDLDSQGPGAIRVLSMAARFDTPNGPVTRAYVFDMAGSVEVSPAAATMFALSPVSSGIDRAKMAEMTKDSTWYAWNADFDERVLLEAGLAPAFWKDLMLYQASLVLGVSGVSFYDSLAAAARRYLGVDLDGKGTTQLSYTASEPLSLEQIAYAAADAVVTLSLVEVYERLVDEADLRGAVALENGARPFRAQMERSGIPFDIVGWRAFLAGIQASLDAAYAKLAELTGGGQGNLFDGAQKPSWKPASPDDVKAALNTHARDAVMARLGRLFEKSDSVDNAALKMLAHPLADALLEWRDNAKVLSTYGEKFIEFVRDDGRVHARYIQNVVSTGRLACQKPNMQNNPPEMKPFYRPTNRPTRDSEGTLVTSPKSRLFVMGDLSQAELRYVAQLSGEPALIEAFRRGADMHAVTAGSMFHVNMDELKTADPALYSLYRARGKTMNFAVIYGLGARALATRLTLDAIPTTQDEAAEFLRLYLAAFPKMAEWLAARDAYIEALVSTPARYDFNATLRLYRTLPKITAAKKQLRQSLGRTPSFTEIVLHITPESEIREDLEKRLGHAPTESEYANELARRVASAEQMGAFRASVVVLDTGEAFSFESRTTVGRRRTFNVLADQWVNSIVLSAAGARRGPLSDIRKSFEAEADVKLSGAQNKTLTRDQLKKIFEDKDLKQRFLAHILRSPDIDSNQVCLNAVADCIKSLGNAYRNAPIQGGVADAVLHAYELLAVRLARFTNAIPVQSVHDSIVLEVNADEALEVARVLRETMEEGLSYFCPDVPARADVDIATSLDAKHDSITPEELARAISA